MGLGVVKLPTRFKQADVTRALKAATAAGLRPSGCKIDPTGAIIVMISNGGAKPDNANPWDEELAQ